MSSKDTRFKPGQSGNKAGRPAGSKISARRHGANKMKKLLKALEPYADESILIAADIMQDESSSQATRLKAAMTLLQKYTELTDVVYFEQLPKEEQKKGGSQEDEDEDEQEDNSPKIALFSEKKSS